MTLKLLLSVDDTPVNLLNTGNYILFSVGSKFVSNLEKYLEDFKKIKSEYDALPIKDPINIDSILEIDSATTDAKRDAKTATGAPTFFTSSSASAAAGSAAANGPPSTATATGLKPDDKSTAQNTLYPHALDDKTMPNHKSKG